MYVEVPEEVRRAAATEQPPRKQRDAVPAPDAKAAPPLAIPVSAPPMAIPVAAPAAGPQAPLLAGTEEDDGLPYTVPADPVDPGTLKPAEPRKPSPPLARSWQVGWPLNSRAKLFALLVFIDLVALPFSTRMVGSGLGMLSALAFTIALQAFLVGTFDRIDLVRTGKEKIRLTRSWRIAFMTAPAVAPIRWGEFEGLSIRNAHEPRIEDWVVCLILLPYGLLPGILWWWFVIQPVRWHVIMSKDHGFPDTILFRTTDVNLAEEVAATVADVTGLPYKQASEPIR